MEKNSVIEFICNTIVKENMLKEETELSGGSVLAELGINSVKYIVLTLAIETEYGIDFEDEALVVSSFETIEDIATYVCEKSVN